jgi:predicted TIM-barrel fold metal-dependent hydrolase
MTVKGDSNYFANHPEYHMYLHPEYPSYETLNAARDRMLEKHPGLRYVGCHLGSQEWNVDELATTLDRFPNMSVDMAARIVHFKVQDRTKVRNFIIKYQDRLLYGTDAGIKENEKDGKSREKARDILNRTWLSDWEYFTTDKILIQNDRLKEVQGLKLPIPVLRKIYSENALRMYPEFGRKQ